MKAVLVLAVMLALSAVLVVPSVEATTTCNASGNWCQGYGHVSTVTGALLGGARCFAIRTTNTAPTCTATGITPVNEATWEATDGATCVTFYYFDTTAAPLGSTVPAAPNSVSLDLRFDNSATIIGASYLNAAAEPANGSSYVVCATSDHTSTGSARAGTYRLLLNVVKNNGNGLPGSTNYNINTDGTATVGALVSFDKPAIRGKEIIASIARSAYPSGSTFAYGTAADEQVTITSTFYQPNGDGNVETMRNDVIDSGTLLVGEAGATVDVDTTSLAQAFTIDSTFPQGNSPYVGATEIRGNAALTGLKWSVLAATGHGANIVRVSDTFAYDSTTFNIDPRIKLDSDGSGTYSSADETDVTKLTSSSGALTELFNRGETYYSEFYIFNARDQQLTRAMTIQRVDSGGNTCQTGSVTPSSGKYSVVAVIPTSGGCTVANTAAGSDRFTRVANTDQLYTSLKVFAVSSLLYLDSHLQISGTLVQDDFPTENANEDTAYFIRGDGGGGDASDAIHAWCHVKGVRKDLNIDTSGSILTQTIVDGTATVRATRTTDTGSDGWTPTAQILLATTPLGTWTAPCVASTFNGNFGSDTQTFTIDVEGGGGGGFPGDPLRALCAPLIANPSETVTCTASENNADGSARTGNAAGTLYDLWNPSNSQIVTGGATTEIGATGNYRFTYSPGGSPALGNYIVVVRTTDATPVTTSTVFSIETDPTVALASSLATVLVDTGLIKGYTDQVEGYTDTLEAGQATLLSNLAAAGVISQAEHQDILDAIAALNTNGTYANATLASILNNITEHRANSLELTMNNDFAGIGFDGFMLLIFWVLVLGLCLYQGWLFAAGFVLPGLFDALFPADVPESFATWFVFVLLGFVLEVAASRFKWGPYRRKLGMS